MLISIHTLHHGFIQHTQFCPCSGPSLFIKENNVSFWGSNNELKYVNDSSHGKHKTNTENDSELRILVTH